MNSKQMIEAAILLIVFLIPLSAFSQGRLLIIAPDEFIDELQPLKRFKDQSGRPTILLSLNQVYNNFTGVDEPEQIKRCIASHERQGVEFVMLVGDIDKFPARYRWWGWPSQEGWAVSDLYYADLYKNGTTTFDDWDFNNNNLYGEIEFAPDGTINNDRIDFLPDVSVGRIPASTKDEVSAYINKVILYELKTISSDAWFKRAGLYTGSWFSSSNAKKDQIGNFLNNAGITTLIKRYWDFQNNQAPANVPAAVINDFNNGLGFANYLGHGNSNCWSNLNLCRGTLNGLNNSGKLPVVFAGACDTSMFAYFGRAHPYVDVNRQEHCGTANGEQLPLGPYPHPALPRPAPLQDDGKDGMIQCPRPGDTCPPNGCVCNTCNFDLPCLAENFLFGNAPPGNNSSLNGAIAYLGARSGGQATILDLDHYFFEAYDSGNKRILGDMWKYMIEKYYVHHNLANSHTWSHDSSQWRVGHIFDEPQKIILFGDPSLAVGGAFSTGLSGNVADIWVNNTWEPLFPSYSRSRIVSNITVKIGAPLTAIFGASILFERETKISAPDTNPLYGLRIDGSLDAPVHLFSFIQNPQNDIFSSIKVNGQIRSRNGGEIKLY